MTDERFGQVIKQYERLVYTICYQFAKNHHTAEDLLQDTFVSAYKHIDDCPEESLKPWLARIATNKAKDHLKSAYNRRITATSDDAMPENKQALFMKAEQPEDITIAKEQAEAISEIIYALKEPYHQVAVLFFLNELTVEEISKKLERPPKTIHTQLYRAKNLLKKSLLASVSKKE